MNEAPEPDVQLEAELRRMFAPERPEPAAFERRVRERIRERESGASSSEPTRLVRWAAGLLPPDVGLALLAKPGGVLTTLSLPVLLVASGFGAFAAGKRSIEKSAREAAPSTAPEPRQTWNDFPVSPTGWGWVLHALVRFSYLPLVFAPLVLGGAHAVDLLALLLLASMGLLAWQVRAMAQAGSMRRGSIARMCCGLLASVYTACFLWSNSFQLVDAVSTVGHRASAGLVLLAIAGCALVAWRERATHGSFTVKVFAWLAFVIVMQTPFVSPSSTGYLQSFLSNFEGDTRDLSSWQEIGAAGEALVAAGEPLPDVTHLRDAVARAIDDGEDPHPTIWTTASRLGLIDRAHWVKLSQRANEKYALDRLLTAEGRLNTTEYYEYLFPMLLATRELSAEQREHLSRRVEASWPHEPKHGRIETADTCVRLWSILGRGDRLDAHREDARSILSAGWIPGNEHALFAKIGGFTSNPAEFRTSFDDTTYAAIDLAARVGLPDPIDPFLVRGSLRAACERFPRWLEGATYLSAHSHAARLRLERDIGLPERTWLERILAERVLIATSLTLLLCLVALRAAPSRAKLEALSEAPNSN